MKNDYIQNTITGCGLYCMSHFANKNLITSVFKTDEERYGSLDIEMENEILRDHAFGNLYIEHLLHANSFITPLTTKRIDNCLKYVKKSYDEGIKLNDENVFAVMPLTVKHKNQDRLHRVYLYYNISRRKLIYADPKEEFFKSFDTNTRKYNFDNFDIVYWLRYQKIRLQSVDVLCTKEGDNYHMAYLNESGFPHLNF